MKLSESFEGCLDVFGRDICGIPEHNKPTVEGTETNNTVLGLIMESTELKHILQSARADERERIRRWAIDYNETMVKHYGTDKHGIALEDLLEQLDA